MVWIATHSPHIRSLPERRDGPLAAGTLIAEFQVADGPAGGGLLWESGRGEAALRLHVDGDGTATAVLGRLVVRLPVTAENGPAPILRMAVSWSVPDGRLTLSLGAGQATPSAALAPCDAPIGLEALLPAAPADWPALIYFGIADAEVPERPVPCFVTGTPIETPDGPVAIEDLRPGMAVLTSGTGVQRIRWTGHSDAVGAGPYAPIRLRAPYFGLATDICVSRDHKVMLSGGAVEYVTGLPEIFVRAGDILGGPEAQVDYSHAALRFHHLMLDRHDCVYSGRCRLETLLLSDLLKPTGRDAGELDPWDREPCAPVADRATAQSIRAQTRAHRRFAA